MDGLPASLSALPEIQAGAAFAGLVALLLVESAHPFFELFRDKKERGTHLLRNLALGLLNTAVIALVFAGLWVLAAEWAATERVGLLHLLTDRAGLPAWAHVVLAVLLLDAWTYAWHRMNHRVPFLWRFHRVHHSDAGMDVTTASRFHVGELVLSSALRVPIVAGLGVYAWELLLYETLMFAVVQFHHANVGLPARLDRALRAVIVTPNLHKVHHSRLQPETDSNYSALFSWWDRIFRSFRLCERPEEIEFGLEQFDAPEHETMAGLMRMPLGPVRPPDQKDAATRPPP
jgi:sterol desaturase/sphingolipid hydroxylase (fatty acid hydroxylase superfamily)